MSVQLTVTTWNTQWATLKTDRGHRVAKTLSAPDSDIIVVTEGVRNLLPREGQAVDAGDDWGYSPKPDRRKVIVWSRFPLSLDSVAEAGAARGRLAVATAETPEGAVRVIGVCIPWRDAHVSTGRSDAGAWSEHLEYLDQFQELLNGLDNAVPTVIAGDFNQRIPRVQQPIRVAERLAQVLTDWKIHTTGAFEHGPHIDHIASNDHLGCQDATDWSGIDGLGRLSDHSGVSCRLVRRTATDRAAETTELTEQETLVHRPDTTTHHVPPMDVVYGAGETADSLLSALGKARIPSENHAFIKRMTDAVGISQYRAVGAAEPYVAATRRDSRHELRIYSGYTIGFTTEDEARRVGAGAEVIRPSYKIKGVWLVSHPKHGHLGRRDMGSSKSAREAAICPTCFQELPRTLICSNCD